MRPMCSSSLHMNITRAPRQGKALTAWWPARSFPAAPTPPGPGGVISPVGREAQAVREARAGRAHPAAREAVPVHRAVHQAAPEGRVRMMTASTVREFPVQRAAASPLPAAASHLPEAAAVSAWKRLMHPLRQRNAGLWLPM